MASPTARECGSTRYGRKPCAGPAEWDVIYRSTRTGQELDRHAACFTHGMAEADRHYASGGIATCDVEKPAAVEGANRG